MGNQTITLTAIPSQPNPSHDNHINTQKLMHPLSHSRETPTHRRSYLSLNQSPNHPEITKQRSQTTTTIPNPTSPLTRNSSLLPEVPLVDMCTCDSRRAELDAHSKTRSKKSHHFKASSPKLHIRNYHPNVTDHISWDPHHHAGHPQSDSSPHSLRTHSFGHPRIKWRRSFRVGV